MGKSYIPISLSSIEAGEGNRTLVVSLEGFCSTIELHPRSQTTITINSVSIKLESLATLVKTESFGGGGRIRTFEGRAVRFTV